MSNKHITFKELASVSHADAKLIKATINQLGYDRIDLECISVCRDIVNFGIDGGYAGFTGYYPSKCFFDKHARAIINYLYAVVKENGEHGETVAQYLSRYRALDDLTPLDVERVLFGANDLDYSDRVKSQAAQLVGSSTAYLVVQFADNNDIGE